MGYGEVEQDLGQFVGVRQHGALPLPVEPHEALWIPVENVRPEEYVASRSSDPDAYRQ
jgi:hypothetical protein